MKNRERILKACIMRIGIHWALLGYTVSIMNINKLNEIHVEVIDKDMKRFYYYKNLCN